MMNANAKLPGTVRIIGFSNQKGLTKDIEILSRKLTALDLEVDFLEISEKIKGSTLKKTYSLTKAIVQSQIPFRRQRIINIFLERLVPELLGKSRFNLLIPNPEWFHPSWRFLAGSIDAVLCKSHHTIDIYKSLGFKTRYLGFTSPDKRIEQTLHKQPEFLHVAGGSHFKGTVQLVKTWEEHPEWPRLLVVTHRVLADYISPANNVKILSQFMDEEALTRVQNESLFHIYPSQAEGFGHCINEAMSCGAIVLTNDAAPMNELVTDAEGFLFECQVNGRNCLSPLVEFKPLDFSQKINMAIHESSARQKLRSSKARELFESRNQNFEANLKSIILDYVANL